MKKIVVTALALLLCGTALARPDYIFQEDWSKDNNNDVKNGALTTQPYTKKQIEQFLDSAKDRSTTAPLSHRVLGSCGVVEVRKGCHQVGDPHVTIWVDGRVKSNQVKACQELNPATAMHVDGC